MNKNVSILLVESGGKDSKTIADCMQMPGFIEEITTVENMKSAVSFLNKQDLHADAKTPDLIIIDWDKLNAIAFLTYVKNHSKLKAIPVIVLSDSLQKNIVEACYQKHANCLIGKPQNSEDFCEVMKTIKDFWINIAELPKIKDE